MGWHYCMAAMYYNSHLVRKGSGNECRSTYNLTLHYSNEIGLMMFFLAEKELHLFCLQSRNSNSEANILQVCMYSYWPL